MFPLPFPSPSPSLPHPRPLPHRFAFRSPGSRRREVDPLNLIPSAATLLIVPGPLVPHWREQIERHADTWALGRVYYEHDGAENGRGGGLPEAEDLARYDVVVLSRERLSNEWTRGKPPCALEVSARKWIGQMSYSTP